MSPEILRTMQPLPLEPVLPSGKRKLRASSLRPGHWLDASGYILLVLQVSVRHHRLEVFHVDEGKSISWAWQMIGDATVIGKGVRRWWHPLLPKWLQKQVCPFTRPVKSS